MRQHKIDLLKMFQSKQIHTLSCKFPRIRLLASLHGFASLILQNRKIKWQSVFHFVLEMVRINKGRPTINRSASFPVVQGAQT